MFMAEQMDFAAGYVRRGRAHRNLTDAELIEACSSSGTQSPAGCGSRSSFVSPHRRQGLVGMDRLRSDAQSRTGLSAKNGIQKS